MPTTQRCPFEYITIMGVRQRVVSGKNVHLKDLPNGWSGTFRWNVEDTTPEKKMERRITNILNGEPSGSAAEAAPAREISSLSQTAGLFVPGYGAPRNASPASERSSASGISGSKKNAVAAFSGAGCRACAA